MDRKLLVNKNILVQITVLFTIVLLFFLLGEKASLRTYSYIAIVSCILLSITILNQVKTALSPRFLFFTSFCIFHMGQFFLYALGIEYEYFFNNSFYMSFVKGDSALILVLKYSILASCLMAIGLSLAGKSEMRRNTDIMYSSTEYSREQKSIFKKVGTILFIISFPLTFIYVAVEIYIVTLYGYAGLRSAVGQSIMGGSIAIASKFAQFFVPSVLLIRLTTDSKKVKKYLNIILIIYIAVYFYIGQRTISLSIFLVLLLLRREDSKADTGLLKRILLMMSAFIAMILFYNLSMMNRGGTDGLSAGSFFGIIISFIGECGFSAYCFAIIASICPITKPFSYGVSYLASLSGLIPSFLDFTGGLSKIIHYGTEFWITEKIGFDFGIGYSLSAESYFNFGYFGLIAILFIGIIIGKILSYSENSQYRSTNLFKKYAMYVMTYEIMTLPRRGMYSFFNSLSYDIILVALLAIILSGFKFNKSLFSSSAI